MMKLERQVDPRTRHRVALAVVLGTVLSALPIAVVLRPDAAPPAPCLQTWVLHRGAHVAIVSAGPDHRFGTEDDVEACR